MEFIVTYQFDKKNDIWKTTKFTDKEKAEDYYNRRLNQGIDKIYFSTIHNNEESKKNYDNNKLLGCGKKYEIGYFSGRHYKNAIYNGGHLKTIKGTLVNYDSPFIGRFFLENDNGALEIIPMASVVEMREVE